MIVLWIQNRLIALCVTLSDALLTNAGAIRHRTAAILLARLAHQVLDTAREIGQRPALPDSPSVLLPTPLDRQNRNEPFPCPGRIRPSSTVLADTCELVAEALTKCEKLSKPSLPAEARSMIEIVYADLRMIRLELHQIRKQISRL